LTTIAVYFDGGLLEFKLDEDDASRFAWTLAARDGGLMRC